MTDNEFILFDRLAKIRSTITKYGEEQFSISFSGGKDSCVLSALVDEALPGNRIPRVYANTGIEYKVMVDFVKELQAKDDRIVIIQPSVPIKPMLEKEGYPFKSKFHSAYVFSYQQRGGFTNVTLEYARAGNPKNKKLRNDLLCPQCLLYQFSDENKLKISDKCCLRIKEEPMIAHSRANGIHWNITGIMRSEGGRRSQARCTVFAKSKNGINRFNPLSVITKEWEEWYIAERNIQLCPLYYPPYNFERTGCKGCPFAIDLQRNLDILAQYFPAERRQCEIIWKPVYDEYRRLGYRLRKDDGQISLFD